MPAGTVMPDSRDGNARPALPPLNNEGTSVMRTLIIAFAILGAAPALAQNPLTTTQSPPAGNSSNSAPETTNSLPRASGTEKRTEQPGSALGGGAATSQPAETAPSNGQGTTQASPPASR